MSYDSEITGEMYYILLDRIKKLEEQEKLNAGEIRNCKQDIHELKGRSIDVLHIEELANFPSIAKCEVVEDKENDIWSTRCDRCTQWAFGCELSGQSRKECAEQHFKFFKPKKGDLNEPR